ncbi:MAG: TGS domain-containing protein [Deltaproteobacteria bacterium]|nr:TGS domain-containing protein [Deltaproteobacteria bacterium]
MAANLSQPYLEAEQRYRSATSTEDKIAALEQMITELPKHKGTEKIYADLKTKLAKLKKGADKKGGGPARKTSEYVIEREGAGQIILLGAPNTGKSSIVGATTNAPVEITDYPFATRKPIPGAMKFEDIRIQLVDGPSIAPEFFDPFFPPLVRLADAALLCVDLSSPDCLDQPDQILKILREVKIELVAGIVADTQRNTSPRLLPTLLVATKADAEDADTALELLRETVGARLPILPISVRQPETLAALARACFDMFGIVRAYSKAPGKEPDMSAPFILTRGSTVLDFAQRVHKDFLARFGFARVWGTGKYDGQRVARDYAVQDRDVIELHMS